MTVKAFPILFVLISLLSFSCVDVRRWNGEEARVQYLLHSGYRDCSLSGIHALTVSAVSLKMKVVTRATTFCNPSNQVLVLQGIPRGQFFIFVDGYDRSGELTYSGHTVDPLEFPLGRNTQPIRVDLREVFTPISSPRVATMYPR